MGNQLQFTIHSTTSHVALMFYIEMCRCCNIYFLKHYWSAVRQQLQTEFKDLEQDVIVLALESCHYDANKVRPILSRTTAKWKSQARYWSATLSIWEMSIILHVAVFTPVFYWIQYPITNKCILCASMCVCEEGYTDVCKQASERERKEFIVALAMTREAFIWDCLWEVFFYKSYFWSWMLLAVPPRPAKVHHCKTLQQVWLQLWPLSASPWSLLCLVKPLAQKSMLCLGSFWLCNDMQDPNQSTKIIFKWLGLVPQIYQLY